MAILIIMPRVHGYILRMALTDIGRRDHFDAASSDSDWSTVGSTGLAPKDADLDEDDVVGVFDYIILSDNFDQQGSV